MEIAKITHVGTNGEIEIIEDIVKDIGSDLKSTCLNDVWLVVSRQNNNCFQGEALPYEGQIYFLPENQLDAMQIKTGDKVKLVYSDTLGHIIITKANIECAV